MFRRRTSSTDQPSPDLSHPIPRPYLEAARNQEQAEQKIQANWQAKLRKIALDNPVVGWAKQAYQLMTSEQVPTSYKIFLIAALLYFLSPLDSIPDVLPGLGYVDDVTVLAAAIAAIRKALPHLRETLAKEVRNAGEKWGEGMGKGMAREVDATLEQSLHRTVAAVSLGLWGATTAVAVGLIYHTLPLSGGAATADPYTLYLLLTGTLILSFNLMAGWRVLRAFLSLPSPWQQRLVEAVALRLRWWHALMVLTPLLLLGGVALIRFTLFAR
jgi:uncharacterized membrane protein YkvA (DUF1232 family)